MSSKIAVRAALLAALAATGVAACSGSDGVASPGEGVFVPSPPPAPPAPPVLPPVSPPTGPAADCPTGFINAGVVASQRNCQLPAVITGSLSVPLRAGTIYSLSGRTDVGIDLGADPAAPLAGGAQGILSIDPGVTIFGSGTLDYLLVNRGSRINAIGSAAQPIVFTSRQGIEAAITRTRSANGAASSSSAARRSRSAPVCLFRRTLVAPARLKAPTLSMAATRRLTTQAA